MSDYWLWHGDLDAEGADPELVGKWMIFASTTPDAHTGLADLDVKWRMIVAAMDAFPQQVAQAGGACLRASAPIAAQRMRSHLRQIAFDAAARAWSPRLQNARR
jgi:hypothetical protein